MSGVPKRAQRSVRRRIRAEVRERERDRTPFSTYRRALDFVGTTSILTSSVVASSVVARTTCTVIVTDIGVKRPRGISFRCHRAARYLSRRAIAE